MIFYDLSSSFMKRRSYFIIVHDRRVSGGTEILALCFDWVFMFGASARGVHVHRLWMGFCRKKAERVKDAKRPKGLSLMRSALPAEAQARWMCGTRSI